MIRNGEMIETEKSSNVCDVSVPIGRLTRLTGMI